MPNPFEELASEYDGWFEKNKKLFEAELALLKSLLPEGRGVEIGVGSGRFAEALGISLGVEPSKSMAEIARSRGIEVLEGCAERLPLQSGEFDFALIMTVFCFLKEPERALAEVHRILKPNGKLIIGLIDISSKEGRAFLEKKNKSPYYRYASFFDFKTISELLKKSGFKLEKTKQLKLSTLKVSPDCGEGAICALLARKI